MLRRRAKLPKCECPHCGQHVEYDGESADLEVPCPGCEQPFVLPPVAAMAEAAPLPEFALRKGESRNAAAMAVGISLCVVGFFAAMLCLAEGPLRENVAGAGLIALGAFVYFVPAFVASKRKHRNAGGVMILNLFLGWTLLGWVGALVWAIYEERK